MLHINANTMLYVIKREVRHPKKLLVLDIFFGGPIKGYGRYIEIVTIIKKMFCHMTILIDRREKNIKNLINMKHEFDE